MLDTTPENKGRVLFACQETEREIWELEKEQREIGTLFAEFTDLIQHKMETHLWKPGQPTYNRIAPVTQYDVRKLPKIEPYTAFELADKLRSAKDRLKELEEEKRALGLF